MHKMTDKEAKEMLKELPRFMAVQLLESFQFNSDIIVARVQYGIAIISALPLSPFYGLSFFS